MSAYTGSPAGLLVSVEQNERTNLEHFFGHEDDNEEKEEDRDLGESDLKTERPTGLEKQRLRGALEDSLATTELVATKSVPFRITEVHKPTM